MQRQVRRVGSRIDCYCIVTHRHMSFVQRKPTRPRTPSMRPVPTALTILVALAAPRLGLAQDLIHHVQKLETVAASKQAGGAQCNRAV